LEDQLGEQPVQRRPIETFKAARAQLTISLLTPIHFSLIGNKSNWSKQQPQPWKDNGSLETP